jgi:guanosine-3',5'-bis(diphosphate) 3'-pyrophosphohydrolase
MARYGYRVMKAEWVHAPDSSFVADIYITGVDDGPGVIKQLSEQISNKLGLNIRSFYIDGGEEGYFEGRISIVVSNTNQISHAIQVLKELPQVHTAERRSQEN